MFKRKGESHPTPCEISLEVTDTDDSRTLMRQIREKLDQASYFINLENGRVEIDQVCFVGHSGALTFDEDEEGYLCSQDIDDRSVGGVDVNDIGIIIHHLMKEYGAKETKFYSCEMGTTPILTAEDNIALNYDQGFMWEEGMSVQLCDDGRFTTKASPKSIMKELNNADLHANERLIAGNPADPEEGPMELTNLELVANRMYLMMLANVYDYSAHVMHRLMGPNGVLIFQKDVRHKETGLPQYGALSRERYFEALGCA